MFRNFRLKKVTSKMPIYEYKCECENQFERLFATISKAAPFVDKYKCDKCGKQAVRINTKPIAFFMDFGDAPKYSSNSNPDKV